MHKGRIVGWFMDAVTDGDLNFLKLKRDAAAQQALEALAVLVGMRLWKDWWAQRRCAVALRGDNMTALTMALTLRAPKGPVKRIARELALDYSEAAFEPMFAEHVAGVSHVLADLLSRRHDSAHQRGWQLPALLCDVARAPAPLRGASFWRLPAIYA